MRLVIAVVDQLKLNCYFLDYIPAGSPAIVW